MTGRVALTCALFFCILSVPAASAQPGDRDLDTKARVLDLLFPLDVEHKPYFMKLILRFGDSDTQIVVVVYPVYPARPGGRSEVVRYSLAGMGDGELSQLISKMVAQNPNVTDREIAARVKVNVTRSPIEYKALEPLLASLKAVRIAPILETRVCVDDCPEYEYWFDDGQESVHYTISGRSGRAPQDRLVQWMVKFRASLPDLLKPQTAANPQRQE